jgi:demethylmenaquinone methyltransferase / 2-methoxy-6-polyprenyl-1,4-benzoquinol methylase
MPKCSIMSDDYFVPGEQRAARVDQLFTSVARRYDLINDIQSFGLHRYWKRKLIRLADVKPGERALDICSGTGDLAIGLALAGAETVGLDFNSEMLRVARNKLSALKLCGPQALRFVQGDALKLPFSDRSFEVVTIGYGLRNLANWEDGLKEMKRVAKPGGRLLVLEFGKPENKIWRALYFAYLKIVLPVLGQMVCGDAAAYAYILESLKQYPGQNGIAQKLNELGLEQPRIINLFGGAMSINLAVKGTATK